MRPTVVNGCANQAPLEHFCNRIAGGTLQRLAALSDGVFTFAMTLLVLEVRVPQIGCVHSERELLVALAGCSSRMFPRSLVAAIVRRILVAQSRSAFGAVLCLSNTYCSIAFIFLVQLNHAIAPRFRSAAHA